VIEKVAGTNLTGRDRRAGHQPHHPEAREDPSQRRGYEENT